MSDITKKSNKKLYRLWALPLLALGVRFFVEAIHDGSVRSVLFCISAFLIGAYAFRHNLFDSSPEAFDPKHIGPRWVAVLVIAAVLLFSAGIIKLLA
ncbi:hypothetical protein [Lysobacter solisilvae (ex Woo and Kim 2020)]|uniref:DUF202 domain-containing protein n=1 Tax=Agrilutibacter terrestris TaxID=2865112 RepID=A0A7H0FVY3_9GAMM|nr:hypothetical protein [Lysobacter terrestris]QNP40199.1 hypothetical protein H8B22_11980 [Lysobacter terrestris]